MPRACMPGNGSCHTTDRPGSSNQNILAKDIKRKCSMGRIAKGVRAGKDIHWNFGITKPDVGDGDRKIFGKSTGSINSHTTGFHTEVPPSSQTVTTATANQMTFTGDEVTRFEVMNISAYLRHSSNKLMSHMHRNRYRPLSPFIPVVDMNIRAAYRCLVNSNQNIIDSNLGNRHLFQPDSGLRF